MAYGCLFNAAILFYTMTQCVGKYRILALVVGAINAAAAIHMIATGYPMALTLRPYGYD